MTLNLTLVTPWAIYQSADFRLSSGQGGSIVVDDHAQKQVVLQYADWSGLLTYTGLARYKAHDTASWLTATLADGRAVRSFDDVCTRLAGEGNQWIRSVPLAHRRHTFVLAAFVRGRPRVAFISTWERAAGDPLIEPMDHFVVSAHQVRHPRLFVTGSGACLPIATRTDLVESCRGASPLAMREELAAANRVAAAKCPNLISQASVSSHLLRDGTGEAQVFGDLTEPFMPSLVQRGLNVAEFAPDAIAQSGRGSSPHRLVGVTWSGQSGMWGMLAAYRQL